MAIDSKRLDKALQEVRETKRRCEQVERELEKMRRDDALRRQQA